MSVPPSTALNCSAIRSLHHRRRCAAASGSEHLQSLDVRSAAAHQHALPGLEAVAGRAAHAIFCEAALLPRRRWPSCPARECMAEAASPMPSSARQLSCPLLAGAWPTLGQIFHPRTEDLERASEQHRGATQRLVSKLLAARRGEPTNLVVLGTSATQGQWITQVNPCLGRWSARVQALLRSAGLPVRVTNLAVGRDQTCNFLGRLDQPGVQPALATADVVLVDFSVSDCPRCCGYDGARSIFDASPMQLSKGLLEPCTRWLIRLLSALPRAPAVAYLETVVHSQCGRNMSCEIVGQPPRRSFPHWATLQELDVPILSYAHYACAHKRAPFVWGADERVGPDGCRPQPNVTTPSALDTESVHPIEDVHDAIGRMVSSWLVTMAESGSNRSACGLPIATEPPRLLPARKFEPPHEDEVLDTQLAAILQSMQPPIGWLDANDVLAHGADRRYSNRFPGSTVDFETGTWRLAVDGQHGQAGWSSAREQAPITFGLNLSRAGYLRLGYLSTYENIGAARCWIGHDRAKAAVIEGRTSSRTSFVKHHTFQEVLPAGDHRLRCEALGTDRFKITSLAAFAGSTIGLRARDVFDRIVRQLSATPSSAAQRALVCSP